MTQIIGQAMIVLDITLGFTIIDLVRNYHKR